MDGLYGNIGQKIKNWAGWIFIIEAIAAVISGIVMIVQDSDNALLGFITIAVGPFVAFVSTWLLYGFGDLIENTALIKEKLYGEGDDAVIVTTDTNTRKPSITQPQATNSDDSKVAPPPTGPWTCRNCGHKNKSTDTYCPNCYNGRA